MLQLRGIEARYGEHTALRDVTLTVPAGSVVALLGPNGAGKSTLLRVASGLLRPAAGVVVLDGEDVTERGPHERVDRGLCHVPEGRGVFPNLTVAENLSLQTKAGREREAVELASDTFPILGARMTQPAGTLSGGEQRMLALARAYVQRPRLVLLDEVSLGLAPKVVDEIFAFIARLAEEGTSLLLVEQYVIRALGIADYLYMLNQGSLVFAGEPAELEGEDVFRAYVGADVGSRA
jgi:branched-chain amino acid transport system ATP-binding protein